MADCHLVTGFKGGTGKSVVCCVLVEFLAAFGMSFSLFETDKDNDDVRRRYHQKMVNGHLIDCHIGVFSEALKYANATNDILISAIERTTLINSPAQTFDPIQYWFSVNALFDFAADEGINFVFWFVTDGGKDSLDLLKRTFTTFGSQIRYVVVKNNNESYKSWTLFDEDKELQKLIRKYNATVIEIPFLMGKDLPQKINALSLTFSEAIAYEGFDKFNQHRVKTFLRNSFTAIEQAGVFAHGQ